jgi:hypothetical protein
MVIGACILSLVIFIIGAILGAGETSTAQGARSEHRDDNGDRNENSEGAGNQEAKASPTKTVTVTARPKPRSAESERSSDAGANRNCTRGYSPCLPPLRTMTVVVAGNGPKYSGPVRVTGSDPYDLDRDGDGKACEWS